MVDTQQLPVSEGPRTYTFIKYVRLVLPLDGYIFWVRADLVSPSSVMSASALGTVDLNQAAQVEGACILEIKGSLHYETTLTQEEVKTYTSNRVTFNAESLVEDLNAVGPRVMYVGIFHGIRYAFNRREWFYEQAGIHHYIGTAIYSDMTTQLVDDPRQLDTRNIIVSNSLPAWLSLNNYQPFYGFGNQVPLFPSFLVPSDILPPWGSVHIYDTTVLASTPYIGPTLSHVQLSRERVRITLYGTRNFSALDFVDCVNQYSADYGVIGLMNMPVVKDEKEAQVEFGIIAQKKSIEYEITYLQSQMRDVARQVILNAIPTYYPRGLEAA